MLFAYPMPLPRLDLGAVFKHRKHATSIVQFMPFSLICASPILTRIHIKINNREQTRREQRQRKNGAFAVGGSGLI